MEFADKMSFSFIKVTGDKSIHVVTIVFVIEKKFNDSEP